MHNTEYTISSASSPIGDDGVIYVGSGDEYMYAVNPDGSLLWRTNLGDSIITATAIGPDGDIYVGTWYKMFSLDRSGSIQWAYRTGIHGNVFSPVVGKNGNIFFMDNGYLGSYDRYDATLFALDRSGEKVWDYELYGFSFSTPAFDSSGNLVVGTLSNGFWVVNQQGKKEFAVNYEGLFVKDAVVDTGGSLYLPFSNLDATPPTSFLTSFSGNSWDEEPMWKTLIPEEVCTAPALTADGSFLIGDKVGKFYCLDSTNGSIKWTYQAKSEISSSATIAKDGTIYFGTESGDLTALWGSSPLADSPWPKDRGDLRNTGRQRL